MSVEEQVGELLSDRGLTLAVAESCTGGLLGDRITSVSGSSAYFRGGMIVYSNEVKTRILGVNAEILEQEGAVSKDVAREMAVAVREKFGSDIAVAVTGIAGPGGGTDEKPIGLVYIGVADSEDCVVERCEFNGQDRATVKQSSSQAALKMLRDYLKNK